MRTRSLVATLAALAALTGVALTLGGCSASEVTNPTPTSSPNPGPSERFQSLQTLDSYRYVLSVRADGVLLDQSEAPAGLDLKGETVRIDTEGYWVAPENEYASVIFSFGVLSARQETIRIGERIWTNSERGAWRERAPLTDPEQLVGQDVPLTPHAIFGNDRPGMLERLTVDLESRPHTRETVNGRETRRWTLDEEWFDAYAEDFEGVLPGITRDQGLLVQIDIWTDLETGVGTRLIVNGRFEDRPGILELEMDLFDLNDPRIAVEEPTGAIGR